MSVLAFHGVAACRGGRMLFEKLDLSVAPGGALVVSGPNGVGKSSLLRIAAGLLEPVAGRVERVPAALADGRTALDEELPLARAIGQWTGAVAAEETCARWALAPLARVPVRLLSTGQRQRANLARATGGPARALWLLDEPANGLDAGARALLEANIAAHRASGGAVVVATHQPVAMPGAAELTLASTLRSAAGAAPGGAAGGVA